MVGQKWRNEREEEEEKGWLGWVFVVQNDIVSFKRNGVVPSHGRQRMETTRRFARMQTTVRLKRQTTRRLLPL